MHMHTRTRTCATMQNPPKNAKSAKQTHANRSWWWTRARPEAFAFEPLERSLPISARMVIVHFEESYRWGIVQMVRLIIEIELRVGWNAERDTAGTMERICVAA